MADNERPQVFIITGAMAAGKSTVAEALARRLPKSVHLRGDVFRRMIVNGAAPMGAVLSADGLAQLALRQRLACQAARSYVQAGFAVVYQDILIGDALARVAESLADLVPDIVVLAPRPDILGKRAAGRSKRGYDASFPPEVLANALARETPRLGRWIDTSEMTVDEVVGHILSR